jgi:nucleotide-binding universal stress UspA family protein
MGDAGAVTRFRRILFATDFSKASEPAWRKAVELASEGTPLLIAHAFGLPVVLSPEGWPLPRTADELAAAVRRDSSNALGSLVKKTRRAGVAAQGLLLTGRTEEAISRAARKHGVDLLVVGTHGRTGLPRLLLGSVASRIIAAAPCPVLAVPRSVRSGKVSKRRAATRPRRGARPERS